MPTENETDPASCRRGSVSDGGRRRGSGAAGQWLVNSCSEHNTARSKLPGCPADNCPADGGVTEWLMVADCKSAGLTPYVGSNPTPTMKRGRWKAGKRGSRVEWKVAAQDGVSGGELPCVPASPLPRLENAGVAQLVEHQPSKLRVAGSSPVARLLERRKKRKQRKERKAPDAIPPVELRGAAGIPPLPLHPPEMSLA
jgi:hypothetical protein